MTRHNYSTAQNGHKPEMIHIEGHNEHRHNGPIHHREKQVFEEETLMHEEKTKNRAGWSRCQQIFASCTLCLATLTCVCGLSVLGPTLLELQTTTGGTDLMVVSWLLSVQAMGSILGCLLSGTTLERWKPWLQMAVFHCLGSLSLALLPVVSSIVAAMLLALTSGVCLGFVTPGTLVLLFFIWQDAKDANSWICAETFFYILGPLVSATVSAPFMRSTADINGTSTNVSILYNTSDISIESNSTFEVAGESRISVAYGILACMGGVSIILLLIVQMTTKKITLPKKDPVKAGTNDDEVIHNVHIQKRYAVIRNILIIGSYLVYICHSIFTFSFGYFLVVFTVGQFNWEQSKGALLTTVYWLVNLFGKIIGMFLVRAVPNEVILFSAVIGVNVCLLGFVFTIELSEVAVWTWTVLISLCSTLCDPCNIIWIEKYIGMRGRIAALPDVGVKSGDLIAAPLIGWLAQEVSTISILYLVWISAGMCLVLLTILQLIGRKQIKNKQMLYIVREVELS